MSASSLLLDGALRAAQLAPLLFALNGAPPAAAQLPRPMPAPQITASDSAPATVVFGDAGSAAPLALHASHVEVRIAGRSARVRTTLTYRNDGAVPVEALYTVPLPAAFATLLQPGNDAFGGCDEPYELAQFAEAGEAPPVYERGSVLLAPGEEVTVRLDRVTDLLVRGDRHRLVLPLPTQRGGVFTPQFSASVTIDAGRPVRELASATHVAEVDGVGTRQARLLVPAGRVHEGQFLALDYTLGDDLPAQANAHAWGGEAHARTLATSPLAVR